MLMNKPHGSYENETLFFTGVRIYIPQVYKSFNIILMKSLRCLRENHSISEHQHLKQQQYR